MITATLILMKKETSIIIFYVFYFIWLFAITYLSPNPKFINYFSLIVVFFYFIFLKEEWDIVWFMLGSLVAVIGAFQLSIFKFSFNWDYLAKIPLWYPLVWGTTVLALRKFFVIISK